MSSDFNNSNRAKPPRSFSARDERYSDRPLLDDLFDDSPFEPASAEGREPPAPRPASPGPVIRGPVAPPAPAPAQPSPTPVPAFLSHTQTSFRRPLDFDLPEDLADLGLTVRRPSTGTTATHRLQTPQGRDFGLRNAGTAVENNSTALEGEVVDFDIEPEPASYISNAPQSVADELRAKRPYTTSDGPNGRARVVGADSFDDLDEDFAEEEETVALDTSEVLQSSPRRRRRKRGASFFGIRFRNSAVAWGAGLLCIIIIGVILTFFVLLSRFLERAPTDRFSVLFSAYGDGQAYNSLNDGLPWAKSFSVNFLDKSSLVNPDVRLSGTTLKDAATARAEAVRTVTDVVVWGYYDRGANKLYSYLTLAPNGPFDPPIGRGRELVNRHLFEPEQLIFVTSPPTDNAAARLPLVDLLYAISSYYSGDYDKALVTLTQLLTKAEPESEPGLRMLRAAVLYAMGKYPEAIDDYNQIIKINQAALDKNRPTQFLPLFAYSDRAFIFGLQKKYTEAEESFRAALGVPKDLPRKDFAKRLEQAGDRKDLPKVYANYAQAILDRTGGDLLPAELSEWQTGLGEAFRLDPKLSLAQHYLGQVYRYEGKYDEAIGSQSAAINLDNNYLEAYYELGLNYLLKNDQNPQNEFLTAALDAFRRGEGRANDIANQNRQRRQDLNELGNPTLAAVWDNRTRESEEQLNRLRFGTARTYLELTRRQGKDLGNPFDRGLRWVKSEKTPYEEAGPRLKQSLDVRPNDPDTNFYYGQYLDLTGEGDAVPYYKKAKELEKNLERKLNYYSTLARQYKAAGKNNEAITEYNDFIKLDPNRVEGYIALSSLYYQLGRYKEAADTANSAIRLAKNDVRVYLAAGEAQLANNQLPIAVNYLDQAVVLDPTLAEAHLKRGVALFHLNRRYPDALDSLNKALALNDNLAEGHYYAGIIYYENRNDPKKAQEQWEKTVAINPGYGEAWIKLGLLYSQLNMLDKAMAAYNRALAINEKDAPTHYFLGLLYESRNDLPAAEAHYRRAAELNSGLVNARYRLASVLQREGGKLDQALAAAQEAVKLDPRNPEAQVALGDLLLVRNQLGPATQAYKTALDNRNNYPEAFYGRSEALLGQKQLDAALSDVNQVISLRPAWANAYLLQGRILTEQGQVDAANASFSKARTLDPDNPALLFNVGSLNEMRGDLDGAIKAYEGSLKGDEPNTETHFRLGKLYFTKRDFKSALAQFQRTQQLDPKYNRIDYWLGRTFAFLDRNDDAKNSFEAMVRTEPNFIEGRYELGNIYRLKGMIDPALTQFDEATRLNTNFAPAWLSKGQVYEQLVDLPKAKAAYETARKTATDQQVRDAASAALDRLGAK